MRFLHTNNIYLEIYFFIAATLERKKDNCQYNKTDTRLLCFLRSSVHMTVINFEILNFNRSNVVSG